MYYFDLRHNVKRKDVKGKIKSSYNSYLYISRLEHFSKHKEESNEVVEYCSSGYLPSWADNSPKKFWSACEKHERNGSRTSASLTIALPKELTVTQRIELSKILVRKICDEYKLPHSFAIHNHTAVLDRSNDNPHLHLQYSERTNIDGIPRTEELFFQQYRPKNPEKGGAKKMTADALGMGQNQILIYRQLVEEVINSYLAEHAPTKTVNINGVDLIVPNKVSCLSNVDYNKKHGTNLQDVPQLNRWKLYSSDPVIQLDLMPKLAEIKRIREQNQFELYKKEYFAELTRRAQFTKDNGHEFGM